MLFSNLRFVFELLGGIFMSTVLIRDAKLSDAPRLLEIYSYYVKNTAITFEYNVPSLEEFRHRMKKHHAALPVHRPRSGRQGHGYAYAGSFIGRAAYDWSCEMTVYLDCTAKKTGLRQKDLRSHGAAPQRYGHFKPLRLHRLYRQGGRVPKPQQCRFSRPPRLQNGRYVQKMRL